jgi:hypothetical protein
VMGECGSARRMLPTAQRYPGLTSCTRVGRDHISTKEETNG